MTNNFMEVRKNALTDDGLRGGEGLPPYFLCFLYLLYFL